MPIQACPSCGEQVTRWLKDSSAGAPVNYYCCSACGHIWTLSKDGNDTTTHVTPLPPKPTRHEP